MKVRSSEVRVAISSFRVQRFKNSGWLLADPELSSQEPACDELSRVVTRSQSITQNPHFSELDVIFFTDDYLGGVYV